jgi:hypothetical protein
MGKTEILAELRANGEIDVFRRSPSWQKAFDLYKKEVGGHKSLNCGSCYKDVKEWLMK